MSDDAAPTNESIDLGAAAPSEPTTPHGATEQQLENELVQQEAGLKQSDPQLYDEIQQEEAAAVSSAQKDPAQQSEIDREFLARAAEQVAAVDPSLGGQMEAEVAALDALTGSQAPATGPTHSATQTAIPTTPAAVVAAEEQFAAQHPTVVAQIEQIEAAERTALADAPGMATEIEQQASQDILGDVAAVDPQLASALERELQATAEQLDPSAVLAEEQRIQERLSAPQPERQSPAT